MSWEDVCVQAETRIETIFISDHLNNIKYGEEKSKTLIIVIRE